MRPVSILLMVAALLAVLTPEDAEAQRWRRSYGQTCVVNADGSVTCGPRATRGYTSRPVVVRRSGWFRSSRQVASSGSYGGSPAYSSGSYGGSPQYASGNSCGGSTAYKSYGSSGGYRAAPPATGVPPAAKAAAPEPPAYKANEAAKPLSYLEEILQNLRRDPNWEPDADSADGLREAFELWQALNGLSRKPATPEPPTYSHTNGDDFLSFTCQPDGDWLAFTRAPRELVAKR